jgi:hypothetical protein
LRLAWDERRIAGVVRHPSRDEALSGPARFRTVFNTAHRAKFNRLDNEIRKDEMPVSSV